MLAGIGGIAASFSWMEPFRSYLIVLTIGVLGFAWYQKLKPKTNEQIECACDKDEKASFWQSKMFLSIVTLFAIVMLAFPSYSHIFYPDTEFAKAEESIQTIKYEFSIAGMTCTGCEEHVKQEVAKLEGLSILQVSHAKGNAIISFDQSKINVDSVAATINSNGYQVQSKKEIK